MKKRETRRKRSHSGGDDNGSVDGVEGTGDGIEEREEEKRRRGSWGGPPEEARHRTQISPPRDKRWVCISSPTTRTIASRLC